MSIPKPMLYILYVYVCVYIIINKHYMNREIDIIIYMVFLSNIIETCYCAYIIRSCIKMNCVLGRTWKMCCCACIVLA